MIITPEELNQWLDMGKSFTAVDIRPNEMIKELPISKLNPIIADINSIPIVNNDYEKKLKNAYSLLGGAQAWDEFQLEKKDFSRWSRQTVLSEIGLKGQKKTYKSKSSYSWHGRLGMPCCSITYGCWCRSPKDCGWR